MVQILFGGLTVDLQRAPGDLKGRRQTGNEGKHARLSSCIHYSCPVGPWEGPVLRRAVSTRMFQ